ncbi:MAG TPA: hypothetical protein DGC56_07795 [Alistipes putredinis]|nr:hypothetical protein [Alistipes putredinis]
MFVVKSGGCLFLQIFRFSRATVFRSPYFSGPKIVKTGRKRDLVPGFPRRILSKTMSKIVKAER